MAQVVDVTVAAATGSKTVAECSIACDPVSGRLILGGHSDNTPGDLSMHLFRSEDGGARWALTRLGPTYDNLGLSRGDPSVAIDDRGAVYMAYACVSLGNPYAVLCARSLDGGVSFEPPTIVVREDGRSVGDKPFLTLGRDAAGRVLVLLVFSRNEAAFKAPGLYLAISWNRGRTFTEPILVDSSFPASYGMAATGPGGEIYVSWLAPTAQGYDVRLTRSLDGGATFEPSTVLASTGMGLRHMIPAAPHRGIGAVPSLAVDTSPAHPGRVYVSYVTADRTDRYDTDIWCRWADPSPQLSQFRWSEPIPVHRKDNGSSFHPWLALDPETGNLAIISHNTRGDPDRRKVDTWLSVSVDGGNRWAERRISESTSDVTGQYGFSPLDYLEYIGVALSKGVAHCAWAGSGGGDPNTLHYLYRSVPISDVAAGRMLAVPGDYPTPAAALAASNAGDHVVIDGRQGPFTGPIDLLPHVTIESAPGTLATLDAQGATPAVRLVGGPFGAALMRIRIIGHSAAGVRLEAGSADSFRAVGGSTEPAAAADSPVPALVRSNVTLAGVTIQGGSVGVETDGIPVQIEECRFEGMDAALDFKLRDAPEADVTRVSRSLFLAPSGTPSSVAIAVRGAASYDAPLIERNTIHGWGTGVRLTGTSSLKGEVFRPVVTGNLVTNSIEQPLEIVAAPGRPEPGVSCNDFWSPEAGQMLPRHLGGSRVSEGDNLSVDPRYCGPGPDSLDLSLRIDSPVSAGNSPCGPMGALDVLCTPAALEADSRLASGTRLVLRATIVIPPGRMLTLEPGCRLASGWSGTNRGTETSPPLIECSGSLTLEGTGEEPVILEPAARGGAIRVPRGADAHLDVAGLIVPNGASALELFAGEGRITGSRFTDQDSIAVQVGPDAGPLLLADSRIDGAKNAGVDITNPAGPVRVTGLRITHCPEAIRLAGGSAVQGEALEWSGSIFAHNDVALHMVAPPGGGSLSCPVGPSLRNNEFRENRHAIVIEPGAARPNLGRAEPGNNLFWNQSSTAVLFIDPACGPVPAFGNRFGPGDKTTAEEPPGSVDWSGWIVEDFLDSASAGGRGAFRIFAMPNPSVASVHFQVEMEREPGSVLVEVHDVAGRRLGSIFDARPPGRRFGFDWNGTDETGRRMASGIYWVVVRDDLGHRAVQKFVRVR